ncbi:cytochrome C [Desulfovibrio aerotolerans]|uniref:Cytochrome C n=1 Tax=Solidesulfovibrio aerotolerans TaxID=295255 RepID=A0A7C9IVP0_9BACT|nr:cytochrome c family protein [Solidesulfovibrio aerotolerans]MYL82862.1 cytochrome C [Solidesulfovibrio aerotolerans]
MVRWRARFKALLAAGLCACAIGMATAPAAAADEPSGTYVGSKVCMDCHPKQYESFSRYSKKSHSSQSVKIMAPKLTPEELASCFACHTTGYGKPGGFVSFEKTPEMADAGCEVCHGPGAAHADAGGDPKLIQAKLAMRQCEGCHSAERVRTFNFKPMLFAGAH